MRIRMSSPIRKKQRFVVTRDLFFKPMPSEALLRPQLNFLRIDAFAGRADEDELIFTHSKFWDRAEVFHGAAAGGAHYGRRAAGCKRRALDNGG